MKKCCVNCAFCARYINNSANSLTVEEHKQALKGNFDFVGREQRAQKEWYGQYKKIYEDLSRGLYHDKLGGGRNVMEIITHSTRPDEFPAVGYPNAIMDTFGLSTCPTAPYQDFLVCWHNLWNFDKKEKEFSTLNNKNKCLFFYPYNKKGNKSFEGCEKEREALLARSRFITTNWLVIFGIIVTILIFGIQTWNNKQSNQQQEVVTEEEVVQLKAPQVTPSVEKSLPKKDEKK